MQMLPDLRVLPGEIYNKLYLPGKTLIKLQSLKQSICSQYGKRVEKQLLQDSFETRPW